MLSSKSPITLQKAFDMLDDYIVYYFVFSNLKHQSVNIPFVFDVSKDIHISLFNYRFPRDNKITPFNFYKLMILDIAIRLAESTQSGFIVIEPKSNLRLSRLVFKVGFRNNKLTYWQCRGKERKRVLFEMDSKSFFKPYSRVVQPETN